MIRWVAVALKGTSSCQNLVIIFFFFFLFFRVSIWKCASHRHPQVVSIYYCFSAKKVSRIRCWTFKILSAHLDFINAWHSFIVWSSFLLTRVCFLTADCEWKAQAGNVCVASFDWSCSGICKSVEKIKIVHERCGEGDDAVWSNIF